MNIHKYALKIADIQNLSLKKDSQILKVDLQDYELKVWVRENREKIEQEIYKFRMYPIGDKIENLSSLIFLNTVIMAVFSFVWYIFLKKRNITEAISTPL